MHIFNNSLATAGASTTMGLLLHPTREDSVSTVPARVRRTERKVAPRPVQARSESIALLATTLTALALGTLLVWQVAASLQIPSLS